MAKQHAAQLVNARASKLAARPRVWLLLIVLLVCVLGGNAPPPPQPIGAGEPAASGALAATCPAYNPRVFPADLGVSQSNATFLMTPGSFAVSPVGEATYTIPLVVPPGRAGVEPSLAITYGSSAGEGFLGVGFGLQGVSAITRCAANMAQDGFIRPVKYDAGDHFCLDGARLVQVAFHLADDGTSTREYRTFPDTFTKVMAFYGADHGPERGPLHFTAFTKAGRILSYGASATGHAMATNHVTAAWWITEERDRRGNAITYSYDNNVDPHDGHTLEIVPSRIEYAHREDHVPLRAVAFVSSPAATPSTRYSAGLRLRRTKLLTRVDMIAEPGDTVVRSYHLSYEAGEGTGRDLVHAVKECAGTAGPCKPPTRFAWSGRPAGFTKHVTGPMYPAHRYHHDANDGSRFNDIWLLADVNGDGLDDLVMSLPDPADASINVWKVALNEGGSFGAAEVWAKLPFPTGDFDGTWSPTPIDYDQDGLTDILLDAPNLSGAEWPKYKWLRATKDHTFVLEDTRVPHPARVAYFGNDPDPLGPTKIQHHRFMRLGDVNGDGVADLVQCVNKAWEVGAQDGPDPSLGAPHWTVNLWSPSLPGGGSGFDPTPITMPYFDGVLDCAYGTKMVYVVDVDGDGASEILGPLEDGNYGALRYENGAWKSVDAGLAQQDAYRKIHFLDVNGDGLPDAVYTGVDCPIWNGWEDPCASNTPDAVGPYPGDVPFLSINGGATFSLMAGMMLTSPASSGNWADAFGDEAIPIDYDGDGRMDLMMLIPGRCGPGSDPDAPCWTVLRSSPLTEGYFHTIKSPPKTGYATPIDTHIPWISGNYTGAPPAWFLPQVTDVNGDGRHDVVVADPNQDGTFAIYTNGGAQDLLTAVFDGTRPLDPGEPGAVPSVAIHYGELVDEAITSDVSPASLAHDDLTYVSRSDPDNDCAYPRACVVGPSRVVKRYVFNDGHNGERGFRVTYRDGRYHRLGRGFLGFGERTVVDEQTAAGVSEAYDNVTYDAQSDTFPFAGQVVRSRAWSAAKANALDPGQIEMTFTQRTLEQTPTNGGATYFTLPAITNVTREEGTMQPGAGKSVLRFVKAAEAAPVTILGHTRHLVGDWDTYGDALVESTETDGVDLVDTITRTYDSHPGNWLVGLLHTERACSTSLGLTQCRSTRIEHDDLGEVEFAAVGDPDDPGTQLAVAFSRDHYGHVTATTASDAYDHQRWSCLTYDADGLFPYASVDALGHVTYTRFDAAFGVMTAMVDANGLATRWQHDAFGSTTEELRADGAQTTIALARTKDGGPHATWWNAKLTTEETGGALRTVELDSLGRPVHSWTLAAGVKSCGASACTGALQLERETTYDALGRVTRVTLPWMTGDALLGQKHDDYGYDASGRVTRHTEPWGRVTTLAYGGDVTTATDWLGTASTRRDALGRVVEATDKKGYATETTYGPFGAAWAVTRNGDERTTSKHDAYGRVVHESDPDRGETDLAYDGFGETLTTDDALDRHYAFTYDALGRLTRRDDPDGTVTWAYDTAPHGVGKLATVTSPKSVKQYAYDALSRLQMTALTLTDSGERMQAGYGYDAAGRVQMIAYPQVPGVDPLVIRREHDAYGNVVAVHDNATGAVYWRLDELDGAGRPAVEAMGALVTARRDYNPASGLVRHITTDQLTAFWQDTPLQALEYTYDEGLRMQGRADHLQVGPNGARTERFYHDAIDRLTCAGFADAPAGQEAQLRAGACALSMHYDASGNITSKSDVGAYGYDPAHPHAVQTAGADSYGYDAVGNQIARPDATIAYTAFDLPSVVTPTNGDPETLFTYDGDQRRIRKQTRGAETVYFEDLYERVGDGGGPLGVSTHRYYVAAGTATLVLTRQAGGDDKAAYLLTDALGSTDVVIDGNGNVANGAGERRSYDAFGARRNPTWGQVSPAGGFAAKASPMGFTGHEHDDELGLIDMRGRVYDPRLGRFLTTDPVVSHPHFGQSWNPYSYVLNSPLNLVDPSGFDGVGTYTSFGGTAGTFPVADVTGAPAPTLPASPDAGAPPTGDGGGRGLPSSDTTTTKSSARDDTPAGTPSADDAPRPGGVENRGEPRSDEPSFTSRLRGFGQAALGFAAGFALGRVPYAGAAAHLATEAKLLDKGTPEARVGRALGEIVGGLSTAWDGVNGVRGGIAAIGTGGGAPAGVVVVAASAAAVTGGLANAAAGVQALLSTGGGSGPKAGSAGGPGAGKRFGDETKDTAEAEASGRCVFCKRETTRSPGGTQRNTDHAIPKSRGGNNTLDNAQNTCRDCNLDKGTQTTQEYSDTMGQTGGN